MISRGLNARGPFISFGLNPAGLASGVAGVACSEVYVDRFVVPSDLFVAPPYRDETGSGGMLALTVDHPATVSPIVARPRRGGRGY